MWSLRRGGSLSLQQWDCHTTSLDAGLIDAVVTVVAKNEDKKFIFKKVS